MGRFIGPCFQDSGEPGQLRAPEPPLLDAEPTHFFRAIQGEPGSDQARTRSGSGSACSRASGPSEALSRISSGGTSHTICLLLDPLVRSLASLDSSSAAPNSPYAKSKEVQVVSWKNCFLAWLLCSETLWESENCGELWSLDFFRFGCKVKVSAGLAWEFW